MLNKRERPNGQWKNTVENTICIMHLKSDVKNVVYDKVLGGKRNKSLYSHSAKLLTYKNKKLCKKKWRKKTVTFSIDNKVFPKSLSKWPE